MHNSAYELTFFISKYEDPFEEESMEYSIWKKNHDYEVIDKITEKVAGKVFFA